MEFFFTIYGHHFMRKFKNATTHQPAHRKICFTPIMCKTCTSSFFFSTLFFIQNTSSLIRWCSNTEPNKKKKKREHPRGSGLNIFCQIHVHIGIKKKEKKRNIYGQVCQARVVSCCSDILLLSSFFFMLSKHKKEREEKSRKAIFQKE